MPLLLIFRVSLQTGPKDKACRIRMAVELRFHQYWRVLRSLHKQDVSGRSYDLASFLTQKLFCLQRAAFVSFNTVHWMRFSLQVFKLLHRFDKLSNPIVWYYNPKFQHRQQYSPSIGKNISHFNPINIKNLVTWILIKSSVSFSVLQVSLTNDFLSKILYLIFISQFTINAHFNYCTTTIMMSSYPLSFSSFHTSFHLRHVCAFT